MPQTNQSDPISALANSLMRAVVNSGCIRSGEQDATLAIEVMREELKLFLTADKYADERSLVLGGGSSYIAYASLTAECVRRIIAERKN